MEILFCMFGFCVCVLLFLPVLFNLGNVIFLPNGNDNINQHLLSINFFPGAITPLPVLNQILKILL